VRGVRAPAVTDRFGLALLSLAGLALSLTWWTLLRSYRALNVAKFQVINDLEVDLPTAPFTKEWKQLKEERSNQFLGNYVELGHVERIVPLVYTAVYVAAGIRALLLVR
jgi:hypothetical protein